jgi:hypothetical protein
LHKDTVLYYLEPGVTPRHLCCRSTVDSAARHRMPCDIREPRNLDREEAVAQAVRGYTQTPAVRRRGRGQARQRAARRILRQNPAQNLPFPNCPLSPHPNASSTPSSVMALENPSRDSPAPPPQARCIASLSSNSIRTFRLEVSMTNGRLTGSICFCENTLFDFLVSFGRATARAPVTVISSYHLLYVTLQTWQV